MLNKGNVDGVFQCAFYVIIRNGVEGGGKVRLVAEENYDTWSIDI